jgi:hypothetical protein
MYLVLLEILGQFLLLLKFLAFRRIFSEQATYLDTSPAFLTVLVGGCGGHFVKLEFS